MVGCHFTPGYAALSFALAGICYAIVTERMLRIYGGVKGSKYGMVVSIILYYHIVISSYCLGVFS